ncbi:MAG TPA: LamG domain-containing protein [Puia sp.]|jgi:hypothetical protein
MKSKNLALVAGFAALGLFYACAKNATPALPIHDTVTVHKTDTLIKTDTFLKPVDTPNLKIGLLLYLPFNGSFADSSGNANPTLVVAGASLTYDMHGYANAAFGGTGNGERIKVSNNGSIKFDTAYSISYDFMQRAVNYQVHLSMVNTSNGYGPTFLTGTSVPGMPNFDVAGNDTLAGCDNTGLGQPNRLNDTTGFIPQMESWYNAILIYHKGSLQTYINGKLISTKTGNGTKALLCPSSQIVIGGWWDGGPLSLNGKLDEVRLYNRVLNAKEIAWLSRNFQPTSTKVRTTPVVR